MIPLKYAWEKDYIAAILETDDQKLAEVVASAESAMLARVDELNMDHGGTPEERESLLTALAGLQTLRSERLGRWRPTDRP
jgi:hypothetical protein